MAVARREESRGFGQLLGVASYADQPYYVGFKVGDQDIGLVPHGSNEGMTAFSVVDDIKKNLQVLLDAGAQTLQAVKGVGGGRLIASARDVDGNITGLIQDA